ncbi:hypothetical protein BJ741DRAFT_695007 [Chytriomyces cf. hyalinus JEL632]|nr:hypothetical protein BJ741DRAFT_695007 [Chytriomyces cf. hyalinus JEL632]
MKASGSLLVSVIILLLTSLQAQAMFDFPPTCSTKCAPFKSALQTNCATKPDSINKTALSMGICFCTQYAQSKGADCLTCVGNAYPTHQSTKLFQSLGQGCHSDATGKNVGGLIAPVIQYHPAIVLANNAPSVTGRVTGTVASAGTATAATRVTATALASGTKFAIASANTGTRTQFSGEVSFNSVGQSSARASDFNPSNIGVQTLSSGKSQASASAAASNAVTSPSNLNSRASLFSSTLVVTLIASYYVLDMVIMGECEAGPSYGWILMKCSLMKRNAFS